MILSKKNSLPDDFISLNKQVGIDVTSNLQVKHLSIKHHLDLDLRFICYREGNICLESILKLVSGCILKRR